jgi:diguanylate cyclase (GGDEF)-like protein
MDARKNEMTLPNLEELPKQPAAAGSFSPRRKRRALWMMIVLSILTVALAALLVPFASPRLFEDIVWPNVVGNSSIAVLATVWLLAVNRMRATPTAFVFLSVGAIGLFLAAVLGMLGDFVVFTQRFPIIIENLGKTGGLLCVTAGLLVLSKHRREAEEALRDDSVRYRALSITDSLSKLFNQAYFLEELQAQVGAAQVSGQELSMILLDIDDFKLHNDRYGHLEGDKVISTLGITIRKTIRGTDIPCRYGGEEFTVLLPGTGLDMAIRVAERLRHAFSAEAFEVEPEVRVRCTVSLGVAELQPDETALDLLRRADMAMFEAKKAGKDQVQAAK